MYSKESLGIRQLISPYWKLCEGEGELRYIFFFLSLCSHLLSLSLSLHQLFPLAFGVNTDALLPDLEPPFPRYCQFIPPDHEGYKLSDRSADRISTGGEKV